MLNNDAGEVLEKPDTLRYKHLKKLWRLTTLMEIISNDYDYSDNFNLKEEYFKLFPDVSERTRVRDYETMRRIGYEIYWDNYEKYTYTYGYLHNFRENFHINN